jgi:hypothetical protein
MFALALEDFEAHLGRVIYANCLGGYTPEGDRGYLFFGEPVAVRVLPLSVFVDIDYRHDTGGTSVAWGVRVVDRSHPDLEADFTPAWVDAREYVFSLGQFAWEPDVFGLETWRQRLRRKFNRRPFWRPEDKKGVS